MSGSEANSVVIVGMAVAITLLSGGVLAGLGRARGEGKKGGTEGHDEDAHAEGKDDERELDTRGERLGGLPVGVQYAGGGVV